MGFYKPEIRENRENLEILDKKKRNRKNPIAFFPFIRKKTYPNGNRFLVLHRIRYAHGTMLHRHTENKLVFQHIFHRSL